MAQILFNNAFNENIPKLPDDYIEEAINQNTIQNIILILPTGKLVRKYNQLTIRKYFATHNKPVQYLNYFTLKQFIEHCYDKIYQDRFKYQVTEPYRLTIFEEALEKSNLKFYSRKDKKVSSVLLEKLANVVFGLKDDGITIGTLEKDLVAGANDNTTFFDPVRLSDIKELLKSYDDCLGDKYLDSPKILNKVLEYLKINISIDCIKSKLFPSIDNIIIFGFSEFKEPEVEFISQFSQTSIQTSIHIDYTIDNGPIFGNLDNSILNLKKSGFRIFSKDDFLEKRAPNEFEENDFDSPNSQFSRELYIRRWLFNTRSEMRSNGFSKMIKILACENKYYEVQNITKLVKHLIINEKYKPSDICICMRQPEHYTALFREQFASYKLPVNISDRFDLASAPIVITIFSILNLISFGFRTSDLHKLLGSKYIKFNKEIDSSNLIEQAKKYRILGGNIRGADKYWKKIFDERLKSIKKRIVTLKSQQIAEIYDILRIENDERNLDKAIEDFNFISSLFPIHKNKLKPNTFKEFIHSQIIKELNLKNNINLEFKKYLELKNSLNDIEKVTYQESIEKDAKALNSFLGVIDEICFIMEDKYPAKEFSFEDLIEKVKTAVTTAKFQIEEKENFGVNITSIEQTRGIYYKVMILCGTIDGVYPMQYRTDTFLGKELKDSVIKHLNSERLQFYQFLTNDKNSFNSSQKQIFITYPCFENEEELVRSSFIDALLKITSLAVDNKIFDINKIHKETDIILNEYYQMQLPWLNLIGNIRELNELAGDYIIHETSLNKVLSLINPLETDNQFPNDYLKKVLDKDFQNGKFNYSLLPDNVKNVFSSFKDNPISITDLELYASCPFKFFVKKMLKMEEVDEMDLSMSPLVKGIILHSILYNFYIHIKDEQLDSGKFDYRIASLNQELSPIIPVNLKDNDRLRYMAILSELAKNELEYIKFEHPYFQIDEERILGSSERLSIIENWLNQELSRITYNWQFSPVLFEFGFGIGKNSKVDFVDIQGLKIRGKIDRIELLKKDDKYFFLIADYKSKTKDQHNNNFIKKGYSFQMPLYILAAKQLLMSEYGIDAEPVGGVYYTFEADTKNKKNSYHRFNLLEFDSYFTKLYSLEKTTTQTLKQDEKLNDVLSDSLDYAKSIVNKISNGEFPAEPQNKTCDYCQFKSICRYNKRNTFDSDLPEKD